MGTSYSTFAGLPIPDSNAATDISSIITALTSVLDTSTILQAASAQDRDTRYGTAPVGTIVISTADQTIWSKAANTPVWNTIWSPPTNQPYTWVSPAAYGSGWINMSTSGLLGGAAAYAVFGFHYIQSSDTVILRGGVVKTSSWTGAGEVVCTLPSGLWPVQQQAYIAYSPGPSATAQGDITPSGTITLQGWSVSAGPTTGPAAGSANSCICFDMVSYHLGALA